VSETIKKEKNLGEKLARKKIAVDFLQNSLDAKAAAGRG
jgi:hypothetical protein